MYLVFPILIFILIAASCTLTAFIIITYVNDKFNKNISESYSNLLILQNRLNDLEKSAKAQEKFLDKDKP